MEKNPSPRPKKEAAAGRRTPALGADGRYKVLVEQLPVGVYRTTTEGAFVEANAELIRMLGFKRLSDLFRRNVKDFYVRPEDRQTHLEKMSAKATVFHEFELRRADGRKFWVRDYSRRVRDPDGSSHYDGILVDVTERKAAERKVRLTVEKLRLSNEKLESLSLSDHLTGLYNRRGFYSFGLQQMKIAKRLKAANYLVFLDIDNLKEVNDAHGHSVGDLLLQGVAAILRTTLRESDVIGRIGGDEFAVLAMRSKGQGEKSLMARIEEGVAAFRVKGRARLRLSVSMGLVAVDPQKYQQLDDVLAQADFLMYRQKRIKERQENPL
ncbi:MAG TPA: sensor domain-containing diguanylate cyclase [Candidatus Aminicenantes bacterium]|nr:sensor domain-containing diguanylate cyclase [Candidatus Aminicenantes bacterium]